MEQFCPPSGRDEIIQPANIIKRILIIKNAQHYFFKWDSKTRLDLIFWWDWICIKLPNHRWTCNIHEIGQHSKYQTLSEMKIVKSFYCIRLTFGMARYNRVSSEPNNTSLISRNGFLPWGVKHEAGRPGRCGSSAGVKLQVDLGEAAGEDGGPDVVFAAHPENILIN